MCLGSNRKLCAGSLERQSDLLPVNTDDSFEHQVVLT